MKHSIKSAIEQIEASKPSGAAKIRVDIYGGGIDEGFIRGTRAGLITAGLRLIRAGFGDSNTKSPNNGIQADENFDDIIHEDSDVVIDWIEVSEDLAGEPQIRSRTSKAMIRDGSRIRFWIYLLSVISLTALMLFIIQK